MTLLLWHIQWPCGSFLRHVLFNVFSEWMQFTNVTMDVRFAPGGVIVTTGSNYAKCHSADRLANGLKSKVLVHDLYVLAL